MRRAPQLILAAVLALAPITAKATAARKPAATGRSTQPKTSNTRSKNQNVKGYTTKKGTRVAPYKRRPSK
jgi:hypothetical protein